MGRKKKKDDPLSFLPDPGRVKNPYQRLPAIVGGTLLTALCGALLFFFIGPIW